MLIVFRLNSYGSFDFFSKLSITHFCSCICCYMRAGDGVHSDLSGGRGDGGGADRQVRAAGVPVDEDVPPLQAVLRAGRRRRGVRHRGQREHGRRRAHLGVQPLPVVRQQQRRRQGHHHHHGGRQVKRARPSCCFFFLLSLLYCCLAARTSLSALVGFNTTSSHGHHHLCFELLGHDRCIWCEVIRGGGGGGRVCSNIWYRNKQARKRCISVAAGTMAAGLARQIYSVRCSLLLLWQPLLCLVFQLPTWKPFILARGMWCFNYGVG